MNTSAEMRSERVSITTPNYRELAKIYHPDVTELDEKTAMSRLRRLLIAQMQFAKSGLGSDRQKVQIE